MLNFCGHPPLLKISEECHEYTKLYDPHTNLVTIITYVRKQGWFKQLQKLLKKNLIADTFLQKSAIYIPIF